MFRRQKYPRYLILEQPRPVASRRWRVFGIASLVTLFALAILILIAASSAHASNLDEATGGELLLREEGSGYYHKALQLESKVDIQVSGMVAEVALQQQFRNSSDRWVEAVYVFPLPDNAAVNYLQMQIGERVIVGEIKEKQAARKIYRQARAAGKKAALVEQQRPNMFTNRVANIGPGETVRVSLRYVQRVAYREGEFSLRFPMTIIPRYIPGRPLAEKELQSLSVDPSLGWAVDTGQVADASQITPLQTSQGGPAVSIQASIDMGLPLAQVQSVFHDMQLSRSEHRYQLQLTETGVLMDRDLLLQWRAQAGTEPRAAFFSEEVAGEHYGLLMVLPPVGSVVPSLARELIFVVDTSGSMGGTSILQAKASLQFALAQLVGHDRFNIIEFNSSARALFPRAMLASHHNLARASEFVRHLDAGGGTEMMQALQMALSKQEPQQESRQIHKSEVEQDYLRQVVFITDGAVGNEMALFQEIQQTLGSSRLFTVGIGSAPNSWFMRKAAQVGGGQFSYIGDLGQVQKQMQRLFNGISRPLVVDLTVDWPGTVEAYPQRIPDLYPGQPVLVSAQMKTPLLQQSIIVRGRSAGQRWQREIKLPAASGNVSSHRGVASLWARQKIEELLDQRILGVEETAVRSQVLPVALTHQLVSPYTSFVAVEAVISRPAEEHLLSQAALAARPQGQAAQPYAYPKTAAGWMVQLLLGLSMLIPWLARLRWR